MLTSCCGFRLTTAGAIIGWLGTIGSLVGIACCSLVLGNLSSILEAYFANNHEDLEIDTIRRVIVICISVVIVFDVINLLASALLLLGTAKKRHLLLVPWLVNSGIAIFFSCLFLVIMFIATLSAGAGFGVTSLNFAFSGLGMALNIYLWLVIYALYKRIQSENDSVQKPVAFNPAPVDYPTSADYATYNKL